MRAEAAASAEHRIDDILETSHSAEAAASAAERVAAHTGVVEFVVVLFAFLIVGENGVRLVYLLEFFRRGFIAGMKVGVVLLREFSVCGLYLVGSSRL